MAALLEVYYYFSYSELLRYVDNPEVISNEVKQSIEIATLARRSASARRHVAPAHRNDYFLKSFAITAFIFYPHRFYLKITFSCFRTDALAS